MIEQVISAYNAQRLQIAAARSKAQRKLLRILVALAVVLAVACLWIYLSGNFDLYAIVLVGTIGVLFAIETKHRSVEHPGKDLQNTLREDIYPTLFSKIQGLRFQPEAKGFFDEIPDGIKPPTIKFESGYLIEGVYQGQTIAINEVTVFNTIAHMDKHKLVKVFKGVALRLGLDHTVPDLSISSDPDEFRRLTMERYRAFGDKAKPPFEDENFETIYDIHCENKSFSNAVFSEGGRSAFMSLQGLLNKSPIQLAATDTTAYVLLSTGDDGDLFKLPSIDCPFDTGTGARRLQDEMQKILDLSDGVRDLLKTGSTSC